jgi:hypothetical protein
MPGMLYYPFVNASPSAINQAALYWDFLATVVPPPGELRLTNSMCELYDRGFYRPIEGVEIFSRHPHANFNLLTKLSMSMPIEDMLPSIEDSSLDSRRMYADKLGHKLAEELIRRGLATIVKSEEDHYERDLIVTPRLQTALMSIAVHEYAMHVNFNRGELQTASISPFTDEPFAFTNAHHVVDDRWRDSEIHLRIEIGRLLPSPRENVMIDDLFRFREKYDDERRRLMLAVALLLSGLSEHFAHPQDVFRAMQKEIESALEDLRAAAKSRKISLVSKSLAALVALGTADAATRLPEKAWVLGVIGGVAINVATQQVRERARSKYSYLYRVDQLINE